MRTLLWAEYKKLRRSSIVWITVFATVMIAVLVFAEGQNLYRGPDMQYGLKSMQEGSRYIDNAGWYMDEAQPLATIFVLPAVIALLGTYIICREEEDDTMKSLRIIPVHEAKLTTAKMITAFVFSVFLYGLLFGITFLTEVVLHFSDLSVELILSCLKEYLLDGVGIFLAVSPIVALVARMKKSYWLALLFTEMYSCVGLFAGMSSVLTTYYPINAVFNFSGYRLATAEEMAGSTIALLLCGLLSVFLLRGMKNGREVE